jgi:hypothetical protein
MPRGCGRREIDAVLLKEVHRWLRRLLAEPYR